MSVVEKPAEIECLVAIVVEKMGRGVPRLVAIEKALAELPLSDEVANLLLRRGLATYVDGDLGAQRVGRENGGARFRGGSPLTGTPYVNESGRMVTLFEFDAYRRHAASTSRGFGRRRSTRSAFRARPALTKLEARASRQVKKAMTRLVVWPWLEQKSGLSGPLVGYVISTIGNPLRFPGQRCTEGHYLPAGLRAEGESCPLVLADPRDEIDLQPGEDISSGTDHAAAIEMSAGAGPSSEAGDVFAIEARRGLGSPSGAADAGPEREMGNGCPGILLAPRDGTGVRSVWHYLGLHVVDGVSPQRQNDETKARFVRERDEPLIASACRAEKIAAKAFVGDLLVEWKRALA